MSGERTTMREIADAIHKQPLTPDGELALVEFLELADGEQKAIIFRTLAQQGAQLNEIIKYLKNGT